MEINEFLNFLKDVPVWGWIIGAIIILIIFGDRKRWEYEVKILFPAGTGRGEIEIESVGNKIFKKREKKRIEIELDLEPAAQNKPYEVLLNGNRIHTITENETRSSRVRIKDKFNGDEPIPGDNIEIKSNGEVYFSGQLRKD